MSAWSRIVNVLRGDQTIREIDEELESHIAEAGEQGRDPAEVRRAFGSALRRREESRDIRLMPWLDALRADAVFGWRQLHSRPPGNRSRQHAPDVCGNDVHRHKHRPAQRGSEGAEISGAHSIGRNSKEPDDSHQGGAQPVEGRNILLR